MAAVIAPPDPVELTLPDAEHSDFNSENESIVLVIDSRGRATHLDGSAPDFSRVAGKSVTLRADAGVSARRIAAVLGDLSRLGPNEVQIAVTPRY